MGEALDIVIEIRASSSCLLYRDCRLTSAVFGQFFFVEDRFVSVLVSDLFTFMI